MNKQSNTQFARHGFFLAATLSALAASAPAMAQTYVVKHAFTDSAVTPVDGANSVSNVIPVNTCFYGTTTSGGHNGLGTVFRRCGNNQTTIYSFGDNGTQDGKYPHAGLAYDSGNGFLYGTTLQGGSGSNCPGSGNSCGTVFQVSTTGTETIIYNFGTLANGADGYTPYAGLTYDSTNGFLYGTTIDGGSPSTACSTTYFQCGTIYQINLTSVTPETVLYSFAGLSANDGANPAAAPILDASGNLYGTTAEGGTAAANCWDLPYGCGTVWELTPGSTPDNVL